MIAGGHSARAIVCGPVTGAAGFALSLGKPKDGWNISLVAAQLMSEPKRKDLLVSITKPTNH